MSRREMNQIAIFESIKKGEITQKKAPEILGLSREQVGRKLKKYKKDGPESLIHNGRGKQSKKV